MAIKQVLGQPGLHSKRKDEEEVVRKAVCACILSQLWRAQDVKGSEEFLHPVRGLVFPSTLGHQALTHPWDFGQMEPTPECPALSPAS